MRDMWTNIKILPSASAYKNIIKFCQMHGLPCDDFVGDAHCTIVFSRDVIVPARKIPRPDFGRVLVRDAYLDVFHTDLDGDVLVLRFESDVLARANAYYKNKYGIPARYEYAPHLTLQKNLGRRLKLPKIKMRFYLNRVVIDNGE